MSPLPSITTIFIVSLLFYFGSRPMPSRGGMFTA
jgi:hypothetical protein